MTEYFTDDAQWQEQAGYSRAVRRGNVVTVSGTTATGPDGAALHPGDTGAQARACLGRIEQALAALGAGLPDVVRTVVYLAPGASWEQAARAHREVLGAVRPASTMLYVGGLIGDGFLVEIEAQAVVAPVRFSVRVNNDLPFAELLALAAAAEQAGFDQLWFSNDLFLRSAPVLAGALAALTERISLGIAVMNPYSVHVSELAMVAATAQEVSGGRFLLGLGAGAEQFLGWAGLPRPRPLAVTRTALVVLRTLLGHADADRTLLPEWFGPDSVLRFPLDRPVPVYVGAMGPKMLEMAGRHADGVLPLLYPPERYATVRPQVLAGAALAGTGLAGTGLDGGSRSRDVDLPACFWVSVSDDAAAGRAALAEKLAYYGPSIPAGVLAASGLRPQDFAPAARLAHDGRGAAALIDDRMLSLGVAGDVADVLARCQALVRLGASHLSFGPPLGPDPVTAVRLLGEQVLPALQEANS